MILKPITGTGFGDIEGVPDLNGGLPIWQSYGIAFAGDADESWQNAFCSTHGLSALEA